MQAVHTHRPNILDRRLPFLPGISLETALYILILLLAVFSRFYILGARVMSHDENSHVYYSWRFYQGHGFQHDPLMHGPIQFHLLAGAYTMFGDNDFTGRLPHALFSIAAVGFLWYYRRYLGRAGAVIGAAMMVISPYMSYYGRYARNEAFIQLFGVVMIWAILRYLETGLPRYLYWLTLSNVLHFTSKETSFIYTAQAMLILGIFFLQSVTRARWPNPQFRTRFLLAMIVSLLLVGAVGGYLYLNNRPVDPVAPITQTAPITPAETAEPSAPRVDPPLAALLLVLGVALLSALFFLVRGLTLDGLRRERSLGMILLLGTLVLPQLAAFPVRWMGWVIPTNASQVAALTLTDILHIAVFVLPLALLSVGLGMLWNSRQWFINAAIWYGVFTVFYTSLFTNGAGFFTGLVGSLGYWLEQQGVERGSQPRYYYALIQVPVYEYLPALGTLLGVGIAALAALRRRFTFRRAYEVGGEPAEQTPTPVEQSVAASAAVEATPSGDLSGAELMSAELINAEYAASLNAEDDSLRRLEPHTAAQDYSPADDVNRFGFTGDGRYRDEAFELSDYPADIFSAEGVIEEPPVFAFLALWTALSLAAYSIAGERMPWLTVHIALPAILAAAWALGKLVDATDWSLLSKRRGWLAPILLPAFLISAFSALGSLLGSTPPFQGQQLAQLQATSQFMVSFLFATAAGIGLFLIVHRWPAGDFVRMITLAFFGLLGVLTARTSIQANFYNYDFANELLVYAHSAPGVKTALDQIEEISQRTTDGLALRVAYDNETSYPFWWYFRNFPNAQYYGSTPSRALRESPVILVGDANFDKLEPVVGGQYDRFDYIRLWWPNQDYYNLTWERVRNALTDPAMRSALFSIWLNRDYTKYGQVVGRDMSFPNWTPSARMRLYIRKDVTSMLWNYGSSPAPELSVIDPFDEKHVLIAADRVLGVPGNAPGQFARPRDLAAAPDGSIYVADTENHRIQHLSPTGEVLHVWGSFGDAAAGAVPGGQFNQPWGIALGLDGSVYVADTWNHRIQKFTADGRFLTMWGYFGQGEQPEAMWGPRDVAVDSTGRVFVTDTGNKRVLVFDSTGRYLSQFGGGGLEPGQFDEPVGIAIDEDNLVYVADTWNQRIQVFQEEGANLFIPLRQWEVPAWYGQSLENKPYLAVGRGSVYIADPEGYRVLQFTTTGEAVRSWGDFGAGVDTFGQPAAVAVAPDGVWVSDTANNRVMFFKLP